MNKFPVTMWILYICIYRECIHSSWVNSLSSTGVLSHQRIILYFIKANSQMHWSKIVTKFSAQLLPRHVQNRSSKFSHYSLAQTVNFTSAFNKKNFNFPTNLFVFLYHLILSLLYVSSKKWCENKGATGADDRVWTKM